MQLCHDAHSQQLEIKWLLALVFNLQVMVADPRVDLKTKNDRGQNLEMAAREVCWCHCKRRKALEAFIQQLRRVKKAEEQRALMGEKINAEESLESLEEKVKVENEMEKNAIYFRIWYFIIPNIYLYHYLYFLLISYIYFC